MRNLNKNKSVDEIYKEMMGDINHDRSMSSAQVRTCQKVYNLVCDFLSNHHLLNPGVSTDKFGTIVSLEAFNDDTGAVEGVDVGDI